MCVLSVLLLSLMHLCASPALTQIDLGGGLRPVKSLDARLAEVAKLGIKSAVIPMVRDCVFCHLHLYARLFAFIGCLSL